MCLVSGGGLSNREVAIVKVTTVVVFLIKIVSGGILTSSEALGMKRADPKRDSLDIKRMDRDKDGHQLIESHGNRANRAKQDKEGETAPD